MRNHSPGFAHMEIMVAQSPKGVCATIFYGVKRRGKDRVIHEEVQMEEEEMNDEN